MDDGTRDGRLSVVARDLSRWADASGIAYTMQRLLDRWEVLNEPIRELAEAVEADRVATEPFDASACLAPLPRAYQWADSSAYLPHLERLMLWRGDSVPVDFDRTPPLYQGGSDSLLSATSPIPLVEEGWECDFEAEVAVVTSGLCLGATRKDAASAIRLVMICNDISLRALVAAEQRKELGFIHSKPPTAFSPVAVTPDELGAAWKDCKLYGVVRVDLNGLPFGRADAGRDVSYSFADILAHAARTRTIGSGSIFGLGTISNRPGESGRSNAVIDGGHGFSCITESRMDEQDKFGEPRTPYLKWGDQVRIEMLDGRGCSVFGAIRQTVVVPQRAVAV